MTGSATPRNDTLPDRIAAFLRRALPGATHVRCTEGTEVVGEVELSRGDHINEIVGCLTDTATARGTVVSLVLRAVSYCPGSDGVPAVRHHGASPFRAAPDLDDAGAPGDVSSYVQVLHAQNLALTRELTTQAKAHGEALRASLLASNELVKQLSGMLGEALAARHDEARRAAEAEHVAAEAVQLAEGAAGAAGPNLAERVIGAVLDGKLPLSLNGNAVALPEGPKS